MRITGGLARGITLRTPNKSTTRPATDRLRESIFSSLGETINGCHALDLFAGTGAYGLEALSRGASQVLFVENTFAAIQAIKANLESTLKSANLPENAALITKADALHWNPPLETRFDLIFIDPPYDLWAVVAEKVLPELLHWTNPGALVLMEHPGENPPPLPSFLKEIRTFGKGRHAPVGLLAQIEP